MKRKLHVHFHDLTEWAPEYGEPREDVLTRAGIERSDAATGR